MNLPINNHLKCLQLRANASDCSYPHLGKNHHHCKLSPDIVQKIRKSCLLDGISYSAAARIHGTLPSNARQICLGYSWSRVPWDSEDMLAESQKRMERAQRKTANSWKLPKVDIVHQMLLDGETISSVASKYKVSQAAVQNKLRRASLPHKSSDYK